MSSGFVNIWIDEIVPCLKDTSSGELKDTVVFRIETKSFLDKFNMNSGWYVNWGKIPKDVEVYALVLKDDISEIQGLIGIKKMIVQRQHIFIGLVRHLIIINMIMVRSVTLVLGDIFLLWLVRNPSNGVMTV